ncbi:hypothetical protein PRIPAC_74644 [Pristionchus pacificus]|uniref:Uncharacterized protein n=1 Tax=Pristionchus pacificus TaxID=54126 RepID=A0A2A6CZM2_PRIPA|nr:hypothetical protein PRIPAC_74644 [Pristionchus pacificus]|eukprot:PDM83578.1 hypothetical protein PRIPAC_30065 [Pristionchus pacificus]
MIPYSSIDCTHRLSYSNRFHPSSFIGIQYLQKDKNTIEEECVDAVDADICFEDESYKEGKNNEKKEGKGSKKEKINPKQGGENHLRASSDASSESSDDVLSSRLVLVGRLGCKLGKFLSANYLWEDAQ